MNPSPVRATPRLTRLVLALLACPLALAAQDPDSTAVPVDSVVVSPRVPLAAVPEAGDTTLPLTPRGAFIRSMILPGWGQAAFDSYFRGGVFFAGWGANWFMNFRNAVRLYEAKNRYGLRKLELRDSLVVVSENPDSMAAVLDTTGVPSEVILADEAGNTLRKLVRARKEQREDWIAWTLFWILASGVDGYVTAHLAGFPASIEVEPEREGGVSLRLEVPLGRTGRPRP